MTQTASPVSLRVLLALVTSIVGLSCAAPLIRLSGAPALTIAVWRLLISLAVVGLALLITGRWREWRSVSRQTGCWCVAAGVFLAVHFWSWNASLRLTSVAASVVLVSLQPVIVLPIAERWLGETAGVRQRRGVVLGVLGAIVVALGDGVGELVGAVSSSRAIVGDLLAFVGAIAGAGYYLIGRRVRQTLSLWPYVGIVYLSCLVVLLLAAIGSSTALWPVSGREVSIYAALALGPMLLGHTVLNWALGHAPAYLVNVAVLGEPVGATLLAWALPAISERPPATALLGGVIVLGGLAMTASTRSRPSRTTPTPATG
jgi:drug/metabolite transporter (DMT)-like permease